MTSSTELWENRGALMVAAMITNRTEPARLDWTQSALAEGLPADRKAELVRELRATKPRTVTVEALAAKAKAAVETARKRREVAESGAGDCVCVAIGFGGTCQVCGS